MITDTQARALDILRRVNVDMPSQFARLLWPDAPAWKRRSQQKGIAGMGMMLAGGGYLGKLRKAGLVRNFSLTEAGKVALGEYQKTHQDAQK